MNARGSTTVDVPRASGALVASEREILESIVGADVVREALASLPASVREEYESITAISKIPTATVERVYQEVARATGKDVYAMHRQLVRASVERALKSIWRVLLRFTGDDALVRRAPLLFSHGLSKGRLQAKMVEAGKAEIRLTDWPDISALQINGIAAAVEAVLSCAGRRGVQVESHRTLDGACLLASWQR